MIELKQESIIETIKQYMLDNDYSLVEWSRSRSKIFQTAPILGESFCNAMSEVTDKCTELDIKS